MMRRGSTIGDRDRDFDCGHVTELLVFRISVIGNWSDVIENPEKVGNCGLG